MSEELDPATKVAGEAIGALFQQSGILGPVKQLAEFLTKRIYYRQLPALVREATMAAEKIERLGLPRAAVDDPLVLRILEDGAWEDDQDMQVVWANLLVNALTEGTADVHPAFRVVLGELEPVEAVTLDRLADAMAWSSLPKSISFLPSSLRATVQVGRISTISSA
jgi:hypothetical protein